MVAERLNRAANDRHYQSQHATSYVFLEFSPAMQRKILLIDDNYHSSTEGAFLNVFERNWLAANGFEVYTLSFPTALPASRTERDFFCQMPTSHVLQRKKKFLGDRHIAASVRNAIEKIDPQIIHCHLISKCPAEVYGALDERIPVVQTLHGPNLFCATSWGCRNGSVPCEMGIGVKCYFRGCRTLLETGLYTYLNSRTWSSLLRKVRVFHCPSRHIMNTALQLGITSVMHIPLGVNELFMRGSRAMPTGDPTAIFVGALEKCKGVDILIEAMAAVVEQIPRAKLRIAGMGELERRLIDRVRALSLEGSVTFLGRIPHAELLDEYCAADIIVVPSVWQEQFGLIGLEAMACGLPCIGSDIGGIREWLIHDMWGALVPPGNVEHLATAIARYLSDREFAYAQGLVGQEYARKNHTAALYGTRLIELFDELIASH